MKMMVSVKKIYAGVMLRIMLTVVSVIGLTAEGNLFSASAAKAEIVLSDTLTARSVFARIPLSVLDLLDHSTRLSMLNYWDVDSVWKAPNQLNGLSYLKDVTPHFLNVQITNVSSLQIKLLPSPKGDVVMTIYSIGEGEGGDSEIHFYDANLKELPAKRYFKELELKDFFSIPKGSVTTMKEIAEMLPFYTSVVEANPDNDDLKVTLTVGDYINQDDYNIMKLFMVPQLTYKWDGKRFKREQQ